MINKFFSKKFFVGIICLLFIILLVFLATESYSSLNKRLRTYNAEVLDTIDQRMTSLFLEINNFPRSVGNDVLFLSRLSGLEHLINSDREDFREQKIGDLEKDFLEFLKENKAYYQLRYIDENGQEIVRVDFDGQNYKVVPRTNLQDKSLRYYFDEVMKLSKNEIYISPLDLNIEFGQLENRGTEENPVYVPVIRYGTPVFSYNGEPKGIVISNIYADYFLGDIRRFQRPGEEVFLINEDGYYLVHPDKEKEFAFLVGKNGNFYNDYPDISREVLLNVGTRRVKADNSSFSFRHIYPTVGTFEVYQGSKKIFGENSEKNYFWVLVTVSSRDEVQKIFWNLEKNHLFSFLFSGMIILIIIGLIFILVFKIPESQLTKEGKK